MISREAGGWACACGRRSAGRLSLSVSEFVRWGCEVGMVGGDAMARLRVLSFVGLRRASRVRDASFASAVAKPRRFSALRLPFSDRRRRTDGSVVGGAGAFGFSVSDWAATRSLLGLAVRSLLCSAETRPPPADVRCCTHHSPLRHRSTRRFVVELTSRIPWFAIRDSSAQTISVRLYGSERNWVLVRRGWSTRRYVCRSCKSLRLELEILSK